MKELEKVKSFFKAIGEQAKVPRLRGKSKADTEKEPAKGKLQEEKHLIRIENLSLEETQLTAQLYNSAGLDPVVEAGLKDYDKSLQREDKVISKVFGPRGSDIKGYGEAVAKRVAFAVYALLNKQYGGKVGDLRSYIMTLEDDRNRANTRYDELMGRVVGILGDEYKELRTDSKEFMERFTTVLGEDLKESKIDRKALAESLADIDGLRQQVKDLTKEKERRKDLESEKATLSSDLAQLRKDYNQLKAVITTLTETIPHKEIGTNLAEELYGFVLKDSKVPNAVIKGVSQFIDLKKYLVLAAEKGAEEAVNQAEGTLRNSLNE